MEQEIENIKEEIAKLKEEIEDIKFSIKTSKGNQKELYKKIDLIDGNIQTLNQQLLEFMVNNNTAEVVKEYTDKLLANVMENKNENDKQIEQQMAFLKRTHTLFIICAIVIILGACSLIFPQIPQLLQHLT